MGSFLTFLISGILVFFMGASIFSFMNVVAYRMPRNMDFINGRSRCPKCGKKLAFIDMIPVVSYFLLGGKCRFCGSRISPRYVLMEIIGGISCLVSFQHYGISLAALVVFLFISVLFAVALIDAETMEIPDDFHIVILVLAVLMILFGKTSFWSHLIGMFCVSVPMLLLALAVPGGFGGGDIKLMAVCGLFMGWKQILVAAFLGVVSGGIYATYLLLTKKNSRKGHFAFGPFLCFGMYIALFWGDTLINAYLNLFL